MDENNSGPVPGIIGQDVPSDGPTTPVAPGQPESGKIFDSSSFTGEQSESLTLKSDDSAPAKKTKGQNPFTKWQLWAIFSGVILVGAAAAILFVIMIFDGKIKNVESVARYDAAVKDVADSKEAFEKAFKLMSYDAYDVSDDGYRSYSLMPEDSVLTQAKLDCLGKYDVSSDDVGFIGSLKTGAELLDAGSNVVEAKERVDRIGAGYNSAKDAIDTCRELVLAPILKDIEITVGDYTTEPDPSSTYAKYVYPSQPITIKNKGKKAIRGINFVFVLIDRNGAEIDSRTVYGPYEALKPGDEITLDLYNTGGYRRTDLEDEAKKRKNYKVKLKTIDGRYDS